MILSNKMNVYFVDYLPKKLIHGNEDTRQKLLAAENVYTVPLDGLAEELRAGGYYHVTLSAPEKSISFYHYNKKVQIFLFMNEDPNHSYKGTVALSTDETVVSYNGMDDILESVSQQIVDGQTVVEFVLEPGHIIVLMERNAAEEGENRIVIEVVTTPAREQMTFPAPPFDFSYEAMDPAGMYGKITLFIKYPEESLI